VALQIINLLPRGAISSGMIVDEVVEEILLPKMTVVTTIVTKNINPKILKMKVMKMNCVL
jgi:hypothetical protein